jgi:hypothetical protein
MTSTRSHRIASDAAAAAGDSPLGRPFFLAEGALLQRLKDEWDPTGTELPEITSPYCGCSFNGGSGWPLTCAGYNIYAL